MRLRSAHERRPRGATIHTSRHTRGPIMSQSSTSVGNGFSAAKSHRLYPVTMRRGSKTLIRTGSIGSGMADIDATEQLRKRLDALIYILMNLKRFETNRAEDRILELRGLGFSDTEVARIIGKTRGYVASVTSRARRETR